MTHSFEDLLDAAKEGEPWAWEQVFHTFAPPVTGYLAVRGAREPEDLCSETLYNVARSIHRFEGSEQSFRSWVFVIAHRKLLDARRASTRRVVETELEGDFGDETQDVESEVMNRVALDEMRSLLDGLTDDQREVIALRMIADMSLAETAEIMGKRVGSIKALQRRALESLRRHIESQEVSP